MARAYYNEFDANAAAWLRELIKNGLIADGDVDERSIVDVQASDLEGYTQCHFFAGIGGWSAALRLAGWPDDQPVWTGSCPCQPFSAAGKRKGTDDERHLWPAFFRLIEACKPPIIFGEQVASSDAVGKAGGSVEGSPAAWIDGVFDDLERASYTCGAADIPAASVGAPHIRQRLYWGGIRLGDASGEGLLSSAFTGVSREETCGVQQRRRVWGRPAGPSGVDNRPADAAIARRAGAGQGARDHGDGTHSMPQWQGSLDKPAGSGPTYRLADNDSGGRKPRGQRSRLDEVHTTAAVERSEATERSAYDGLEHAASDGRQQWRAEPIGRSVASGCGDGERERLGDASDPRPQGHGRLGEVQVSQEWAGKERHGSAAGGVGHWSDCRIVHCRDGKARRIPAAQSGFQSVADGLLAGMDGVRLACADRFPIAGKIPNRVMLLRGAGNAIVPQVAAEFVRAFVESVYGG